MLEIDPESSFGTGQHETTALCLELLEKIPVRDKTVLDMGCGSGILGIGASLMGAKNVVCVDIDKNATEIAAKNAAKNDIRNDAFTVLCGDVLEDKETYNAVKSRKYDIILSNIAADVICRMAPVFHDIIIEDGILICSGIIAEKKEITVGSLKESGFTIAETAEKNDWVAVKCIRKPKE